MYSTIPALLLQLERDRARDVDELRRRDRAVGRQLSQLSRRQLRLLRAWVDRVVAEEERRRAESTLVALRSVGVVLMLLGAALGAGLAAAVYRYDGSDPINILPAVGLFAIVPLLTLLPLGVALLPAKLTGLVPGLKSLRRTLSLLGGGWIAGITRMLPQRQREALQRALGRGRAELRILGSLQKWMILTWSQSFAVAFHVGAIGWFIARVLVTDLSFTWSTTAEAVTPERVHALTQLLSAPWAGLFPTAVPSPEDVQATQYFRLGAGSVAGVETAATDPAALGRWWSFLFACMVCYGLLPRVLSWAWCAFRRERAARWTALHLPGVADLLDRLESARVETRAEIPDVGPDAGASSPDSNGREASATLGKAVVVAWSGLEPDAPALRRELGAQLGATIVGEHQAGAGHTLEEDAEVASSVAEELTSHGERASVVLFVKGWEPPTMEIVDFVGELREHIGAGVRIVVAAMAAERAAQAGTGTEQWRRRMSAVGDPWLRVIEIGTDGAT